MVENETFKKISLEIYKSNINKEDSSFYESILSKSLLKDEEKEKFAEGNGDDAIRIEIYVF